MSQESKAENVNIVYNTISQLAEDKSFCFSEPALRYYVLHAHKNGLDKAIRRIGARKLVIRRDLFIAWIEEQAVRGGRGHGRG